MNFINYLHTVLKTNPNFDETQINRFLSYFMEATKWNHEVSLLLEKEFWEFEKHAANIIREKYDDDYEFSDYFGFSALQINNVYDSKGSIDYSLVTTEAGRMIFKKKGLHLRALDENCNKIFINGVTICYDQNEKYGLINKFGEVILKPVYDHISPFCFMEQYLIVIKEEKYRIINFQGIEIPSLEFDYIINKEDDDLHTEYGQINDYAHHYLIVIQNGLYGLLNQNLERVLECQYPSIYAIETDFQYSAELTYFILKNKAGKFAYFNPEQKLRTPFFWDDVYWNNSSFHLPFRRENEYGFFNIKTGHETLMNFPFELDSYLIQSGIYYHIKHKTIKKFAVMNRQFELLTTFSFEFPVTIGHTIVFIYIRAEDGIRLEVSMSKEAFFKEFAAIEKK